MKTKVTIIGSSQEDVTPKKKIEFVKYLRDDGIFDSSSEPDEYINIELISLKYSSEYDLMFAYNTDRSYGTLYIGHFNDGVV